MGDRSLKEEEDKALLERAKNVLTIEARAIEDLAGKLGSEFCQAVNLLYGCKGKVVITGVGKSGLICQKIAATLASTGTPAIFLHPVEGFHGDLGVLTRQDVVIAISNSGETEEVNRLLPVIKRMNVPLIAFTGKPSSTLGQQGDVVIDTGVKEEACPMNLIPTASTTATLATGDALAITLLEKRGFKAEDFAMLHPGGSLGKRLLLKVEDLMHSGEDVPRVAEDELIKEAIYQITSKRLGLTLVLDRNQDLAGVITDGDLRRGLEKGEGFLKRKAHEIMTKNPKKVCRDDLAAKALQRMEQFSITSLIVVKSPAGNQVEGIVHIHDILKAGIA